ncbi:vacuolar protein sorting-associated protein VTA1 [Plasmodium gonderi]|uniref:Vacuolar protein sorting-associated protein VTA1 n=1 Tax=Plasmodium gonderi TaxID=77519 RepID=A0A1Y1JGD6_PLAGO|nr:vacuolar protein sorting-associated protein VTA1 [Plasmodium gonderi]GAW79144.1 vacuolar protein sorting-associated protein VTA1 [Plasmodium gonderi]
METPGEEAGEKNKKVSMKSIQFIWKKAQELERDHLLVSFLCTLYIVEQLNDYIKNNSADIEAKNILMQCLNKAEQVRPSFDSVDYTKLADFCKKLFLAADKHDRQEEITKKTLQMFFTSQIFYEILSHFRKLDPCEKKKYLYAKYKTVYLKNCFDNNVKPEPGTPRNETTGDVSSSEESPEEIAINGNEMFKDQTAYENQTEKCENFQGIPKFEMDAYMEQQNGADIATSLKHAQYAVNGELRELNLALSCLK